MLHVLEADFTRKPTLGGRQLISVRLASDQIIQVPYNPKICDILVVNLSHLIIHTQNTMHIVKQRKYFTYYGH